MKLRNSTRILHVITSLDLGGAQEVLYSLLESTNDRFEHDVIFLKGINCYSSLEALGVNVEKLSLLDFRKFIRLVKKYRSLIKVEQPVAINGWMYHGNLFALLFKFILVKPLLFFSIHNCSDRIKYTSFSGALCSSFCSHFSFMTDSTVFVSDYALRMHRRYSNSVVIHNPLKNFNNNINDVRPDVESRLMMHKSNGRLVFLAVGRYHEIKNFGLLFKILSNLDGLGLPFHLIMAGTNIDNCNAELHKLISNAGLLDKVTLLGEVRSVGRLYALSDFTFVTSYAESFSNVLLESISLGTPFVSTDVGIAKRLKAETCYVLEQPDINYIELVSFIRNISSENYRSNTISYFNSIKSKFSIQNFVNAYVDLWDKAKDAYL